mmetsp:Transcript_24093/g.48387  ORF Transcript_24093/g.48387 Transcript_24093/m.48387 type:complete len:82 (+) Transcript_24093:571-816(+)
MKKNAQAIMMHIVHYVRKTIPYLQRQRLHYVSTKKHRNVLWHSYVVKPTPTFEMSTTLDQAKMSTTLKSCRNDYIYILDFV